MSPSTTNTTPDEPAERIEDVDVSTEMENSFLEYAYSVIYSRALPDARRPQARAAPHPVPDERDGPPPRPRPREVGPRHGRGDGQAPPPRRLRHLRRDGAHGAVVHAAGAAHRRARQLRIARRRSGSPRYTEARLAASALAMVEGLDEDVVDFVPNYDNAFMQPAVLPAAFPNLLVNGASGIAVGMATNMVPHNLIEVVEAARHLIDHPDASLDDLMSFVPGPDLPTGGTIIGLSGVRTRTSPAAAASRPARASPSRASRRGSRGSSSPSCRTSSAPRRSSRRSRTASRTRSSRASRTSPTSRTGRTGCGS